MGAFTLWGAGDNLGGGRNAAILDREVRGSPGALYTDWKNVYKREPTEKERLRGKAPTTQFGRMCERLEIRIIAASSPQAKGRVERNNGVHQDRLVKKLRRQGIQSYEATNAYLEGAYLPEHNRRFARAAARAENYHVRAPSVAKLREAVRLETERWISNEWVAQYQGTLSAAQAAEQTLWTDAGPGLDL